MLPLGDGRNETCARTGKRQGQVDYPWISALQIVVEGPTSGMICNRMISFRQVPAYRQEGFPPGKSDACAAYKLLREKEEAGAKKEKGTFVCLVFQQALGSLHHDATLCSLEKMKSLRRLREDILNSIHCEQFQPRTKLIGADDLTKQRKRGRGIKQGSALRLWLVFVRCLGWALRRTEEALSEFGVPKHRSYWLA